MSMIVPVLEEPEIEVIWIRIPSPLNSRNGKCSWHTVGKMKKKVKKQYNKYYFFDANYMGMDPTKFSLQTVSFLLNNFKFLYENTARKGLGSSKCVLSVG